MPDWRFHRHVMRLALYLRERCGLKPAERIALVAPLCPEWLVVDWATVLQGAATVVLDPSTSDAQASAAWEELKPRVALVGSHKESARLLSLEGVSRSLEHVISLDSVGPSAPGETVVPYIEALDLGGTLDTAERANAMRALARTIGAGQLAAAYPQTGESLTNGDVAARVRMSGEAAKRRKDAVVAVEEETPVTPALHTALYSYVADGSTCLVFGGREGQKQEVGT